MGTFEITSFNRAMGHKEERKYQWLGDALDMARWLRDGAGH